MKTPPTPVAASTLEQPIAVSEVHNVPNSMTNALPSSIKITNGKENALNDESFHKLPD